MFNALTASHTALSTERLVNRTNFHIEEGSTAHDCRNLLSDRDRRAVSTKFRHRRTKFREKYAR